VSFGSPWLLLCLIAVPLVVVLYAWLERRRKAGARAWSASQLLPNMVSARASRMRHVPALLILLGLTFLIIGFARPQRSLAASRGNAPTVVLVFDVSGSMASDDVPPTRIRAARAVAQAFLAHLPASYRVAVVTFGEKVQLLAGPTFDHKLALAALPTLITPLSGTRIGDGIDEGVSAVIEAGGKGYPGDPFKPGSVVVLSDGAQTAGGPTPQDAGNTAYLDGVPVDTVAVGTSHGVVQQTQKVDGFPVPEKLGVAVFPASLQAVAQETGGTSLAVSSPSQESTVANELANSFRRPSSSALSARRHDELSAATAAIAAALVALGLLLSTVWFGRLA
jgi:Ca-activated chloride channel family protein